MTPVEHAREYISERVFRPVLAHPEAEKRITDVISASKHWVYGLERVGDIYNYMLHVIGRSDASALELLELELESYETIIDDFEKTFAPYLDQRTTLEDFIVGTEYTSRVINGVAKKYDTRSGGILTVGSMPNHPAVLIKVNLSGGKYDNEWLEGQRVLKYYLKATTRKGSETFSEERAENKAISGFPQVPVYVFTRQSPDSSRFLFCGLFSCVSVHTDPDDKKWFELCRRDTVETHVLMSKLFSEQEDELVEAKMRPKSERDKRLSAAPKKPRQVTAVTIQYYRNQDVVAEVLERAEGVCEGCQAPAPFKRASNGTPYLEVHHKVQLSKGGDDAVENAIALCPNCHRKMHYG